MNVKEVLLAAKDNLQKFGWTQQALVRDKVGKMINFDGPLSEIDHSTIGAVCLAGAVHLVPVPVNDLIHMDAMSALNRTIVGRQPPRIGSPIAFNDAPGRTVGDIIQLIDQTIASLPKE